MNPTLLPLPPGGRRGGGGGYFAYGAARRHLSGRFPYRLDSSDLPPGPFWAPAAEPEEARRWARRGRYKRAGRLMAERPHLAGCQLRHLVSRFVPQASLSTAPLWRRDRGEEGRPRSPIDMPLVMRRRPMAKLGPQERVSFLSVCRLCT